MHQYGHSNQEVVSERKLQWQPIKQNSYLSKLNNFKAQHAHDHHCNHNHHHHHHQHHNQDQCWSPSYTPTSPYQGHQMNTWTSDKNQQSFGQCHDYLQTHHQNMSESNAFGSLKKLRNLSNEENKMHRVASDFNISGHMQQSHFNENQISVQNQKQNGTLILNLNKGEGMNQDNFFISSASSKASTQDNSNSNCNSDVEIIEDDYAKTLQPMPALSHAKSTYVPNNQTTIERNNQTQPFGLQKLHSSYSTYKNYDNFDDCSSTFTGEATRSTMKKRFSNKEERFEFNQKIEKMKKTEMCRNIIMYQHCKYGDSCSYAHNMNELVPKQHLPSNYKTKLCSQYQHEGYCMYGQRCQFLHSIYDLTDKSNISYQRGLKEEARLTWQRIQQGSDCIMVNILKGKGCVAPDERLPCFVQIYNKEDYKAELQKQEQERISKGFSNSYGNFDRYSQNQNQYNKQNSQNFQQYSYQQRKSEPWSNKDYGNNSWDQKNYYDCGSATSFKSNYRRFQK